jgi:TonB-linked SusC/RagA family outer membrane protein
MHISAFYRRQTVAETLNIVPENFPGNSRSQVAFIAKPLLIMKLTIIFLAMGLLTAQAKGLSQNISYSGKNVSLTKIFDIVEKQTGFTFFANKDMLREARAVTVSVKEVPLKDFLDLVFQNQPISYEIDNRTIFIKKRPVNIFPNTSNVAASVTAVATPVLIQISGTVTDAQGKGVEGATVVVKETNVSAATNSNGEYSISADAGHTLVISHVSFDTHEEVIGGRSTINITLQEKVQVINQVIVTALGIKKQYKSLTYNIQELRNEELIRVKDANFVNSLNGRVAGVTINSASSGIGGSARVVMRGAKSLFGNNNALYVVDGIPLPDITTGQPADIFSGAGATGDGISNINPEDIESVSVLTGPAAAALYGSQAANGVVLINTKKGTAEGVKLSLSNSTTFFSPFVLPRFQNTYGSEPEDFYSNSVKLKTPSSYDPKDFFQTGTNVTNTINLSTGTDKNQTYFSASSVRAKGIISNNELKRYNFSVRNTSNLLNGRMNLDLSAMYVSVQEQNMLSQGQYFNPLIPIYLFPRGDDIEKYQVYERYDATRNFKVQFWPYGDLGFQMQNPYWIINRDLFNNNKDRLILSGGVRYALTDWLSVVGRVKLDNNETVAEKKFHASTAGLFASPAGAYYNNSTRTRQTYADVLLSANKKVNNNLNLSVNLGSSILDARYDLMGYGGHLLSVPNLFSFSNVNSTLATPTQDGYHDQIQSVYGSAQLGYRNMFFIDLTGRNDWSSALVNTDSKSIFYSSIGASAILTDLLKLRSPILSFAKIRGSYSEVGNAPQRFISLTTYPIIGGFPTTTSHLPATGLQPERTKSYEAGINFKFLRNHISLDVTAYQSSTFNQLFNPSLAPSTGYSSFYVNAGEVSNRGIEASLGYNGKPLSGLEWTTSATFTLNRNKIEQLLSTYTDKQTGQTVSVDSLSVGGTGSYMMALVKGGSIGDIYVTSLVTDEHGYVYVNSATQTVTAAPNSYVKAGNASPRYNIGYRNNFRYKNFELDFLVNARIGGVGVSVTQAIMDRFGVSETSANARDLGGVVVNGFKVPVEPYYSVVGGGVAGVGSMYVYSATNVRLAEASLGYFFPLKNWFNGKIKGLTVSAVGRNLFMFYNKAPFDPESTSNTGTYYQGIDYFMQPSLRSVGFSARVQF